MRPVTQRQPDNGDGRFSLLGQAIAAGGPSCEGSHANAQGEASMSDVWPDCLTRLLRRAVMITSLFLLYLLSIPGPLVNGHLASGRHKV
jgi:hypothetical protein